MQSRSYLLGKMKPLFHIPAVVRNILPALHMGYCRAALTPNQGSVKQHRRSLDSYLQRPLETVNHLWGGSFILNCSALFLRLLQGIFHLQANLCLLGACSLAHESTQQNPSGHLTVALYSDVLASNLIYLNVNTGTLAYATSQLHRPKIHPDLLCLTATAWPGGSHGNGYMCAVMSALVIAWESM